MFYTTRPEARHIDYGLSGLRELLDGAAEEVFDFATLFGGLSRAGHLAGFEVSERFYEIGSPAGLSDLERYLEDRESSSCAPTR